MTDEERSLTLAGIDDAYCAQVGKLFGELCSATEAEFNGAAGLTEPDAADRFAAGLKRALEARTLAMAEAAE